MCFWSECYATHKTFSAANYYANWAAGRFRNARRPKIIYISPGPRSHSAGIIFHIYLAAAISHSQRLHTKIYRATYILYIFILMRVSPSCLFIKNGFLSFLSLSAPSRLFDFLCIFIGDKASLHDEDRFPLEELHHTKLPSNMHATHSTPCSSQFRAKKNG